MSENNNQITHLANRFVNNTQRHIFLTGKAGTGKTTFLHQLAQETYKKMAIAAPTGIAAINAGGVTLHSLLQLPFGTFIPDDGYGFGNNQSAQINTPRTVKANFKINKTKRQLLQELELLIIDEVSMLRADLLDCIDTVLRHVRRKNQPFGGLQLLFIGDLLQLPPVVKDYEQKILSQYYTSSYFFAAKALEKSPPVYLELEKIYRQQDDQFVGLLNRFRNNNVKQADIDLLNQRYVEEDAVQDESIKITTHNRKADEINQRALTQLSSASQTYRAEVYNDFPENMYPVSDRLELKVGAQVMFIKNDHTEEKRYFNGKIGKVHSLSNTAIEIMCDGDDAPISVEKYEWENIRYTLNKETQEVEQQTMGTFKQFPLKLAWAITVHKSQGLTFEKATLDLSGAFAPGQIYVALSRLTSLEGLSLSSKIADQIIAEDNSVADYARNKQTEDALNEQLQIDQRNFVKSYTIAAFDLSKLAYTFNDHLKSFNKEESKSAKQQYQDWTKALSEEVKSIQKVAVSFQKQLANIVEQGGDFVPVILERLEKAQDYFDPILSNLQNKINEQIDALQVKSKVKKYIKELESLEAQVYSQRQTIAKTSMMLANLQNGDQLTQTQLAATNLTQEREEIISKRNTKKPKTPTSEISYDLYKAGLSLDEIAAKRGLVPGTIASHLCHYIEKGEISALDFIDQDKLNNILKVSEAIDSDKSGEIKAKLGDEYTYEDIKFAIAHKRMT